MAVVQVVLLGKAHIKSRFLGLRVEVLTTCIVSLYFAGVHSTEGMLCCGYGPFDGQIPNNKLKERKWLLHT